MLKHRSLVMIFSDLLVDVESAMNALYQLRHGGHDIILFHILDHAEVHFPFEGICELRDPETEEIIKVDAPGFRSEYLEELEKFRDALAAKSMQSGIDYVPVDTSMQFDKALIEYLHSRKHRF